MSNTTQAMPSPELFFETAFAFERSAALKTAVELDLFTAMDGGAQSAEQIAVHCQASPRGVRTLCHFLTSIGFLEKIGESFTLTPMSRTFLTRSSPAYLGGTLAFLASPDVVRNFDQLTETVRRGTIPPSANNTVSTENPAWVTFARAMVPMIMPSAMAMADILRTRGRTRILDIAAGHGMFGITIAQQNPEAEVVAVDWPSVLDVARENASRMAIDTRFQTIPGDAFAVDFGNGFDLALVTNFLHHFDTSANIVFMRKVAAALKPNARVAILEFVPNPDKVSPPIPAQFGLMMLAGTPTGDVYSLPELTHVLEASGFSNVAAHQLPTPQMLVVGTKA